MGETSAQKPSAAIGQLARTCRPGQYLFVIEIIGPGKSEKKSKKRQ